MKYAEQAKTHKIGLHAINIAKASRNSHCISISTYNRLTGNKTLDVLSYNHFKNCLKSINAKKYQFVSVVADLSDLVRCTAEPSQPRTGIISKRRGTRSSPNTQAKTARVLLAPVSHHRPWPRYSRIPRCSVSPYKTTPIPVCLYFLCEKDGKSMLEYHKYSCSKHFQVFLTEEQKNPSYLNTGEITHWAFTILLFNMINWEISGAASLCVIHLTGTTIEEMHSSKAVNSSIATANFITVHGISLVKNYCLWTCLTLPVLRFQLFY